jgi:radical SAM superfamily enzyme YgiQ (UPF0313 family)
VTAAVTQGINQLKLYYMIGLPTETDDDIEAIIKLTLQCKNIIDRCRKAGRLSVNIAPFVPKANTPFQHLPMAEIPVLKHRLSWLKNSLQPRGVNSESPAWSEIQAVLARGDSSLAPVLADMDQVTIAGWQKAVKKHHLDVDYYAHRQRNSTERLPWSVIAPGGTP